MAALLKEESKITAKGPTTVPKAVRQAFDVDYGRRIAFGVDDQQRVCAKKAAEERSDPVVDRFLVFLAQDMAAHPATSVVAFSPALQDRVAALTGNMDVDLDAEIDGDVTLQPCLRSTAGPFSRIPSFSISWKS